MLDASRRFSELRREGLREAEIRNQKVRKSVNLVRAVRISGDGGQEGRHLAPPKKIGEFKTFCFKCENDHLMYTLS